MEDRTLIAWFFGICWAAGCYFFPPLLYAILAYIIANSILNNANVQKSWQMSYENDSQTRDLQDEIEKLKREIDAI